MAVISESWRLILNYRIKMFCRVHRKQCGQMVHCSEILSNKHQLGNDTFHVISHMQIELLPSLRWQSFPPKVIISQLKKQLSSQPQSSPVADLRALYAPFVTSQRTDIQKCLTLGGVSWQGGETMIRKLLCNWNLGLLFKAAANLSRSLTIKRVLLISSCGRQKERK